jgi:hypothetical protein
MLSSSWPGSATSFRLRAQAAAATTASDETAGWTPGHHEAARWPDSARFCVYGKKNANPEGGRRAGTALVPPGNRGTRLASRSSVGLWVRKCH